MESQSKMISLFNALKNLFGFLAILLSFWAAITTAFFVGPSMTIMFNLDGYRPATFTIEKLVYIQGAYRSTNRTYDKYWAEGTIAGIKEKFNLGAYVKGTIQNQEDLEAQLKINQKLPVYYNPNIPAKHEVRVLYPDENFYEVRKQRRNKFIRDGYLPLTVFMVLCIIFGLFAGKTVSAIRFCFGSLFIVGFVWIFILLKWLI